jgi:mycoredoxin
LSDPTFILHPSSFILFCYDARHPGGKGSATMEVKVYGADWCADTQRTLKHLQELGVAFKYIDIEQDEAARQWVREHNDGKESKPTLDIAGQVLSTPTNRELESALREIGFMA